MMKVYQQSRSHQASKAFTLVELLVVVSIIALLVAVLLPSLQKAREQARSVKCLANLHAYALAVMSYTAEYRDYVPGPIHPAIFRNPEKANNAQWGINSNRTLNWLLRPQLQVKNNQTGKRSETVQELSTCPTAAIITRDSEFTGLVPAFSYAANSYGPLNCPLQDGASGTEWYHTDQPFYFGCWYWGDPFPASSGAYNSRMWKPKALSRMKFASDEWAFGDAWYREISGPPPRVGTAPPRQFLGTFPSQQSSAPLPSAPYHSTSLSEVRTSKNLNVGSNPLPRSPLKGKTNLAYFDGHAASFFGQWNKFGEGGTARPYWFKWGGKNTTYQCP